MSTQYMFSQFQVCKGLREISSNATWQV